MFKIIGILVLLVLATGILYYYSQSQKVIQQNTFSMSTSQIQVFPISHASFALQWGAVTVYADPVGNPNQYTSLPKPNIVVITHEHGDHLSTTTLEAVVATSTIIIASPSVAELLPNDLKTNLVVLKNGDNTSHDGITIEAVPAYNLRPEDAAKHPRGRDNGYVLTMGAEKVYIAGDTEDIPEMRALRGIDIAFVPMNLPFTMSVERAAEAVLAFKPKHVYPYHYRTPTGFSDITKFKELITAGEPAIDVVLLDWYKQH